MKLKPLSWLREASKGESMLSNRGQHVPLESLVGLNFKDTPRVFLCLNKVKG